MRNIWWIDLAICPSPAIRRPKLLSFRLPSWQARIMFSTFSALSGKALCTQSLKISAMLPFRRTIVKPAPRAPRSAAALIMAGTSLLLSPGIIGAAITLTPMPRSDNFCITLKRPLAVTVRGSSFWRNCSLREVMDTLTLTRFSAASSARISISRKIRLFLVIMLTGFL
jgi:hypothetical protein